MQKNKIHILSTRPVGKDIIDNAALQDIIIDEISFIKTEVIINKATENSIKKLMHELATIVFTSMNAVEAVNKYLSASPAWNIYCIGNTTKDLVIKFFGQESIAGFAKNATLLAEEILKNTVIKEIIFFCGDQRRDSLPEKLISNDLIVKEIIVYKTIETSEVIKKRYDGILFYSPSAVKSFFQKNIISENMQLFAIGATTADAIKQFTSQPVIIAEIPGKENLVNLAIDHFSKSKIL